MTEPKRPLPPMDAETFMAWYEQQPDGERYELHNGRVFARNHEMQGERASHARAKGAFYVALADAIRAKNLPCEAFVDGLAVRIDNELVFEPDVFVRCGPPVPGPTISIADPVIVVEVLSPGTLHIDIHRKFNGYFRNPSVLHYVVVDSTECALVHHRRTSDGRIESSFHDKGPVNFEPPGVTLDLDELFKTGFA